MLRGWLTDQTVYKIQSESANSSIGKVPVLTIELFDTNLSLNLVYQDSVW